MKIRNHLRSIGEGGWPTPLFAFGSLSDFARYLRTNLPADGLVGGWIEEVRSNSSPANPGAATMVSSVVVAPVGVTGRADAAHSLVSAMLSSGGARIGAAVSAVALSTASLLPAVILGSELSPPSDTAPVAEVGETEPPPALPFEGDLGVEVDETPDDRAPADIQTRVVPMPVEASQPSRPTPDNDAAPGAAGISTPIVEDVIEPLVGGTVDALVDDVVGVLEHPAGVIAGTAGLVDETAGPLLEDPTDQL